MNQEEWSRLDRLRRQSKQLYIFNAVTALVALCLLVFVGFNHEWIFHQVRSLSIEERQMLIDKWVQTPVQTPLEKQLHSQLLDAMAFIIVSESMVVLGVVFMTLSGLFIFSLVLGGYAFRINKSLQFLK